MRLFRVIATMLVAGLITLGISPVGATESAPGPFPDVPADSPFAEEIAWLVAEGIATGYSDGLFRPGEPVSRQAMMAYLYRLANPGAERPVCASSAFVDVPADSTFCGEIAWAVDRGITNGYSDGSFLPGASVSRGAMVTFLYRLQAEGAPDPVCVEPPFSDVPIGPQCGAIAWAVGEGIVNGYPDGTFLPGARVSRQAMAAFLYRFAVPSEGTAELRVEILNLPDGIEAPVTLVSPRGVRTPVSASTVIVDALLGRWSVEAPEVVVPSEHRTGGTDTYWAEAPAQVQIGAAGADLVIDYFTVVPDTTVVLPDGAVANIESVDGEAQIVSLAPEVEVAVGDVLVSGVTATTPTGLLAEVTAVESTTPLVVRTAPATLLDAVGRGRLEVEQQVTASTDQQRAAPQNVDAPAAMIDGPARIPAAAGLIDGLRKNFECEFEADSLEVDTEFEVDAWLALDAEWDWFTLEALSFDARVEQAGELVLEAELEAECVLDSVPMLARPVRFPALTFMVGPVPVVLVPQLQLFLEGEVEASARLVSGVTESVSASVGVGYDRGEWAARATGPEVDVHFLPPQPQLTAAAAVGLRARLSYEMYGLVGPYLSVTPGLAFEADAIRAIAYGTSEPDEPAWRLAFTVNAGAGIASGIFGEEWGKDDLIRFERVLAEGTIGDTAGVFPVRDVSAVLSSDFLEVEVESSVSLVPVPGQVIRMSCLEAEGPTPHANGTALVVSRTAGSAGTVRVHVKDGYWSNPANVLRPGEVRLETWASYGYAAFEAYVYATPGTGPITLTCASWYFV